MRIGRTALVAAFLLVLEGLPGYAGTEVTAPQLQAVARTLGFVNSLTNSGALNIGIVYLQDDADAEARAAQVAALLASIPGPGRRVLRGMPIAVKDMAQAKPFDAYLLMPGSSSQGALISEVARRRHIISISTDPACLDANCCVLMVSVASRVRIVLDVSLASASGAQFSPVFAMMVERK